LWLFFRDQVQKRGIQVMYETPAQELIQRGDTKEIVGAYAQSKGAKIAIKAKKGVVLACGGFEFNYEMQKQFFPCVPIMGIGTPGNTGDGIKMAVKAGADLWHMTETNGGTPGSFKAPGIEPGIVQASISANSMIWIDKTGLRYTNEKAGSRSHGLGTNTPTFDAWKMDWTHVPTWAIFDEAALKAAPIASMQATGGGGKWTWFIWQSGYTWSKDNSEEVKKGWILKADTLADLAAKIKADPDDKGMMDAKVLDATVTAYNKSCADKKDPLFGRTDAQLAAIQGPPYYALKLWPNTANTMGGPRRNKLCQIVDPDMKPIARLYGTGELGSFWGWGYSSGGNLGECMFSGRIAANHAVALKPWDAAA
jgi:3-oxosteroid 1-dehydrogenase